MALEVEDGIGKADAEGYISATEMRAFCAGWGYDLGADTDEQLEVKIRLGAEKIDARRYKGAREFAVQALQFPRTGLTDWSGHEVTGVPLKVKKANAELAFKARTVSLDEDLERGGRIKSESTGPLSTTYADDAPAGTVFTRAEKFLEEYVRDASHPDMTAPAFETGDPMFTVGMHDYAAGDEV